jgi:hypothetical protein
MNSWMRMDAEHRWGANDREKPKYLSRNVSLATLPTRSPTKTELGSNTCLRGEKSTTNCLRLGTTLDSVHAIFYSPSAGKRVKEPYLARSIKDSCSLPLGPEVQRNDSFDLNEVFYLNISHLLWVTLPVSLRKEIGFFTLEFFAVFRLKILRMWRHFNG